jgi:hypothetical protein
MINKKKYMKDTKIEKDVYKSIINPELHDKYVADKKIKTFDKYFKSNSDKQ